MSQNKPAGPGDLVSVIYTGKLEDGTVFDSNRGMEDLFTFKVGEGQVIQGFDAAVRGLEPGKATTVKIPAEEAYGPRDDELVIPVSKAIFGETQPGEGTEVALRGEDGAVFNGKVERIEGETVHVDLNHPLAGKTLVFEIELVKIGA